MRINSFICMRLFGVLFIIMFFSLLNSNNALCEWEITLVDQNELTVRFLSLTIDENNNPSIAYSKRDTPRVIKYASYDGNIWAIEDVKQYTDVCNGLTLAFDSRFFPRIVSSDWHQGQSYSEWNGSSWQTQTFGGLSTEGNIEIDSLDRSHIAWYRYSNLEYRMWDGSNWQVETVDSYGDVGYNALLELDSDGHKYIAYGRWVQSYAHHLKFAYFDGLSWSVELVDVMGGSSPVALTLDNQNNPVILYMDSDLTYKLAKKIGGLWQFETTPFTYPSRGRGFVIDEFNNIHRACYETGSDMHYLKYYFYDGATWSSEIVDQSSDEIGSRIVDLARSPNGTIHIVYNGFTRYDVKYARKVNGDFMLCGVNSADDGLSAIDPQTGEVTFIGPLDPDVDRFTTPIAMAVHPTDGRVFVWSNTEYGETTGVLLTVDPTTGVATKADPNTPHQGDLGAIAFAPDGRLFGTRLGLHEIKPATGERTYIGSFDYGKISAADFSPNGVLYGITSFRSGDQVVKELVTIDIGTGAVSAIANLDVDIGTPGSIVFHPVTGTLIGSAFGGPEGSILYDLDINYGTVSNIRSVSGGFAPQGMGFVTPDTCLRIMEVEVKDSETGGIPESGKPADVVIRIINTGNSKTEARSVSVFIFSIDVEGEYCDLAFVERQNGEALLAVKARNNVAIPSLDVNADFYIELEAIFYNACFTDKLHIEIVPDDSQPFCGTHLSLQKDLPFKPRPNPNAFVNCISELATLIVANFIGGLDMKIFLQGVKISTLDNFKIYSAFQEEDIMLVGQEIGRSVVDLFKVKLMALGKPFIPTVLSALEAGFNEWKNRGCGEAIPHWWSYVRDLMAGMIDYLSDLGHEIWSFIIGSPVDIEIIDKVKNVVYISSSGVISNDIPDSVGVLIEDGTDDLMKMVLSFGEGPYIINLYGRSNGFGSLNIIQPKDNGNIFSINYNSIVFSANTHASMDINAVQDIYILEIDHDGDGFSDEMREPDNIDLVGTYPLFCKGDFNHDGDVDGSDLAAFATDFGRTDCGVPTTCLGDFDNDGDVDGSDLAVFAADFGRTDCPE